MAWPGTCTSASVETSFQSAASNSPPCRSSSNTFNCLHGPSSIAMPTLNQLGRNPFPLFLRPSSDQESLLTLTSHVSKVRFIAQSLIRQSCSYFTSQTAVARLNSLTALQSRLRRMSGNSHIPHISNNSVILLPRRTSDLSLRPGSRSRSFVGVQQQSSSTSLTRAAEMAVENHYEDS